MQSQYLNTVAKTLKDHDFAYFGIPEKIHIDLGRQVSHRLQILMDLISYLLIKKEAEDNTADSPLTIKRMED